jgi:hypothetical protein
MRGRYPGSGALPPLRRVLGPVGGAAACRRGCGRPPHDAWTPGRGTRDRTAVTRDSSAWTGQARGRWRRSRSLDGLTCAATVQRVSRTVEGWACARGGCGRVEVRRA